MRLLFLSIVLSLIGVGMSAKADSGPDAEPRALLSDGYSLLYTLDNDESRLSLILMIKTTPPTVGAFAKEISKMASDQKTVLEKLHDESPALKLDKVCLPQVEQDVRDSIRDDKQHQLLFVQKGNDFARYLLISQFEASTYGANIAKVLSEHETSPRRGKEMSRLSAQWGGIRDHALQMLKDY